jgi:uncharacterized protein YndB with AHSA1/START domain
MNEATETGLPELRISRVFAAPRMAVFRAWSTSDRVRHWFCPQGYGIPQAQVEMHVGGKFEVTMRSPEGVDYWLRGRFTEIVPQERLAIAMRVGDADGRAFFSAHTVVTFADEGGGTRMEVVQTYTLEDPARRWMIEGASAGWQQTLDRLAAELAQSGERSVVHATFRIERNYAAPLSRVWRALTEAEAKAEWFTAPAGEWQATERAIDVRPGGHERLVGRWRDGAVTTFAAVYHDVVPGERLVYAYDMYHDGRKLSVSLATIELTAEGAGTRLSLTEQGAFLDGYDDAGSRERGTGALLDALGAALADRAGGPIASEPGVR